MKFAQDIVLAPVITENSMAGIADKKYTFKVATNATKVEIAQAVEELFGVKVAKVNTISVRGRYRRQGMHAGYTPRRSSSSTAWSNWSPPGKRRAHGPAEGPHMGI